jgi:hypothetical protein
MSSIETCMLCPMTRLTSAHATHQTNVMILLAFICQ